MNTQHIAQFSRPRKLALAALTAAWSLDLGYGIFVTQGLSLIKITLLLLSLTLAFSEQKGGAIGCALVALLMAALSGAQAASFSSQPPSPGLIASLATLTLFFLATLFLGVAVVKKRS